MRRSAVVVMVLLAAPAWAQGPAQAPAAQPLTLQELERRAIENNPTLPQAAASVDAARARARQAGAWPNPIIGYSAEEVSGGRVNRGGEHGVFYEQQIPLGGKLRLSRSVFERETEQAEVLVELQRERVLAAVRTRYYEILTTDRRIDVLDRLSQLAFEAVDISRQLYNVGAADKPDVLESEIEAHRTRLELTAARNRRATLWRQLAATVGDPALAPHALAGTVESLPEMSRDAALKDILARSPQLRAARAELERHHAVVARSRKEASPDLFIRLAPAYSRELLERRPSGTLAPVGWELGAEAGLSVPLFNRNQGGIAAARADEERAQGELRRLELAIETRLASVFDEYLTSLRASEVYRTEVVPRAEEAYQLYLAKYRQMAAAYPQVMVAQRTLFQMTGEYFERVETAWRSALRIRGFLLDEDGLGAPMRAAEMETEAGMPSGGRER